MQINRKFYFKWILIIFISISVSTLSAQKRDSIATRDRITQFITNVTITTKGISTFPNLTVGKPAAIFEVIAGRRLTFEPQFRFTLEGVPWNFIFWWRYKLFTHEKFRMSIGAHPAFAFRIITDTVSGIKKEHIRSDRYLAAELTPLMPVTNNIALGLHYIYARGVEKDVIRNTHFIAFRTVISNLKITDAVNIRIIPQVYYLNMDQKDGTYFNASILVAARNFPISVSSLFNKSFKTEIAAKDDLLWNISLIYSFRKEYREN